MEQNDIVFLRVFFITTLALQIVFIIKKILFHIKKKHEYAAYFETIQYKEAFLLFLVSIFYYIGNEIANWRGFEDGIGFITVLIMIFDLVALLLFVVLTRNLYEVHVFYRPTKKKTIDIDKSYIVVYDLLGRKKTILLNQIDSNKSKFVHYKPPAIIEYFIDPIYAYIMLNDNKVIKIRVGHYINDPKIGMYDIRHTLKIPFVTVIKGKEI